MPHRPHVWPLQDAKNHFSEVVDRSMDSGPQWVTRHGRAAAVVISAEDYAKLTARPGSLVDFFSESPLKGVKLDLGRDRSPVRPGPEL